MDIPPYLAIPGLLLALLGVFAAADKVLLHSVILSHRWRIPSFMTGAIVIGFGTSAPELSTSIFAALNDKLPLVAGNALGSNTANVLLVLGTTALLSRLTMSPANLQKKFFALALATILPGLLLLDHNLDRIDAAILLLGFAACLYYLNKTEEPFAKEIPSPLKEVKHVRFRLLVSLLALIVMSQAVVSCAISTARYFEISELLIGLTIIAIGTSLPELSTVLVSVRRKQHTLALGNIFGSNIFNSLVVIGIPTLIAPGMIPAVALTRDYPVMLGATVLLYLLLCLVPPRFSLGRSQGGLLLICFIVYQASLYRALIG